MSIVGKKCMTRKFVFKARHIKDEVDFRSDLNDEQYKVVTAPCGPMLVIAGAGSGKTRALTYRLAWLVQQGVDPGRILLVTFTNRAAREMLHRVELLVDHKTKNLWGGTFHHIANRILRLYGTCIDITPDFSILDREDARDLIGSCITEAGIPIKERRFPQKAVLAKISSFVHNTLEPLETILDKRYPMFIQDINAIQRVLALYAAKKHESQLLDYDDLLSLWLRLLMEHEDIHGILSDQFIYILVDEYQDTNAIQGAIIDLLASKHRNLTVVGDDSQSIYSFRGASFKNIISFKDRYPDAQEYRLEANYRSTPQILALANASIAMNIERLPKKLRAIRPQGLKPAIVTCYDHFTQSRFLAEYILHLLDEGRDLSSIAILFRSHWHSLEIQLELQRRNIPFHVRGGLRFFEQAHIKDVIGHLRIIHNSQDEIAWIRVLKLLPRIGGGLSRKLWNHIHQDDNPLQAALEPSSVKLFPPRVQPFYLDFTKLLKGLSELTSPAEMIEHIMARFYEDYLVSHYDRSYQRVEDIKGLVNFASQYVSMEAFLADLALAADFSGETVLAGPDEQEFVILSTIHQAKGLEWPVVFIPWLADGRFPTDLAINTQEEEEEERRVFHVAVTRAKDELYLVVPQVYRSRSGGLIMMKPSRFLTEIDANYIEKMVIEEGLPHLIGGEVNNFKQDITQEETGKSYE
jgi:DNA helicase-2/ATP-dependent DNA helicase PcrA